MMGWALRLPNIAPMLAWQARRAWWLCEGRFGWNQIPGAIAALQARILSSASRACPVSGLEGARDWKVSQLDLATHTVAGAGHRTWTQPFDDPEDRFSLHRLGWLLPAIARGENPDVAAILDSWQGSAEPAARCHDSYSICERIANVVLSVHLVGADLGALPARTRAGLLADAWRLAGALEYHGQLTNNHAFNNGRGLVYAGTFLSEPQLLELGIAVVRDMLPRVFRDGMLDEGSSHYHLLVTRWLGEVRWIAHRFGLRELESAVEPIHQRARQGVELLLVKDSNGRVSLPLIGDISPDCLPEWLLAPSGWPALESRISTGIGIGLSVAAASGSGGDASREPILRQHGRWHRLDWRGWTWICHLEDGLGSPTDHSHCESASFVLYWKGGCVLTDGGRRSYRTDDEVGKQALEPLSHNSILFDGLPAICSRRLALNRYPPRYTASNPVLSFVRDSAGVTIVLEHCGPARLLGVGARHQRSIRFADRVCTISDAITARRRTRVSANWMLPVVSGQEVKPVSLSRWSYPFGSGGLAASLAVEGGGTGGWTVAPSLRAAWISRRYGEAVPGQRIYLEADLEEGQRLETTLQIDEHFSN